MATKKQCDRHDFNFTNDHAFGGCKMYNLKISKTFILYPEERKTACITPQIEKKDSYMQET